MNSVTRLAVISDNVYLVRCFAKLIEEHSDCQADYYYSSNNTNPGELESVGCKPINLKVDYGKIISSYQIAFSLHCKQIFPKQLVGSVRCYNLHPGLNPYNRGWFPQVFSIMNKLPAGATLHEMDEKIDHGDIVDQQEVSIDASDNSLSAYNKIIEAEIVILNRSLNSILSNDYKASETTEGNYNSIVDYEGLLELDLNKQMSVGEVIDRLRALTHPPYRNAYFIDPVDQKKCYVSLNIEKVD